jgi:hypothetical protein
VISDPSDWRLITVLVETVLPWWSGASYEHSLVPQIFFQILCLLSDFIKLFFHLENWQYYRILHYYPPLRRMVNIWRSSIPKYIRPPNYQSSSHSRCHWVTIQGICSAWFLLMHCMICCCYSTAKPPSPLIIMTNP